MDESTRRGIMLLAIAREAIARATDEPIRCDWREPWLCIRAATFVTLRCDGELRGCIGTVDPHRALGDDVANNARAAAYQDRRFGPVTSQERARLGIEVSLLSIRSPVAACTEAEAAAALRPGVDGVVFEFEERRATFLPQVWENLPDPVDFLVQLRVKAQLPERFWHPGVKVSRYTVEKFL
jgi:AmmeMemoRadiSam system protein A